MTLKFKYSYLEMVGKGRRFPRDKATEKIKIGPKRKIALVCSGGATKAGAFHLGVALALQERGFKFYSGLNPSFSGQTGAPRASEPMEISTYVGSSAGAIISTYLAAGYSLDTIFDAFLSREPELIPGEVPPKRLARMTYQNMLKLRSGLAREQLGQFNLFKKIFTNLMNGNFEALLQFRWLKATGIFTTAGIEQYMREDVLESNRFQDYAADLFIVATQLNHSRKVVFGKYNYQPPAHDITCQYNNDVGISDACAASTSIPLVFSPYPIQGADGEPVHYMDGEIRDTLSTHVAIDAGADLVIASYTHQPYHLMKNIGSLTQHGIPSILIQALYLLIERKITHHIHNSETKRSAIDAVGRFCKENSINEEISGKLRSLLEAELHYKMSVDTIYIHPDPHDSQLFFGEHFTLSPKKMADMVRSGFRAAIEVLRRYEFADFEEKAVIGTTQSAQEG